MRNISVIVPSFNSIATIKESFESLFLQHYSGEIEYIFIDGGSTDGTLEYLNEQQRTCPQLRVISCTDGLSASRNTGVRESRYRILAFTDSDCSVPKYWLSSMSEVYERWKSKDERVVGVGGSNIPPEQTSYFYDALETMKNSYLGSHGSVYGMSFPQEQYLPHIATVNALYEKEILLKFPFDEDMIRISEDADITWRMSHEGYCFVYNPAGSVHHTLRPTVYLWAKNMFLYGEGRVMLFRKYPSMMIERPILLAPMLLVIAIALFLGGITYVPFSLYIILILLISFYLVVKRKNILLFPLVVLLFLISHTSYGLGQWEELLLQTQGKRGKSSKEY